MRVEISLHASKLKNVAGAFKGELSSLLSLLLLLLLLLSVDRNLRLSPLPRPAHRVWIYFFFPLSPYLCWPS